MELVHVYIDITGNKNIWKRPGMLQLIKDCQSKKVNCIATQTKAYLAANTEDFFFIISCNRNDYPKDDACDVAYPEEWQIAKHGLNYLQRQRRDRIIEGVSKKDISIKGRKMVNPLIGVIPSRDEIESELSDLLMSM